MDFTRGILCGTSFRNICIFYLQCKLRCFALFGPLVSRIFVESVKTDIMNLSKRQTTPWTKASLSLQSLFDDVRLRLENFPQIQWPVFVAGRSRGPNLVFHWSTARPSWQPLWWGKISFQNFRSLNLGLSMRKSVWGFSDIPNIFPFTRSQFTKIRKYSIRRLASKKPHTLL